MAHHQSQFNCQRLPGGTPLQQIVYEIYPDLTWQAPDTSFYWFEIALRADLGDYLPPDEPRSREVFSALMDVAELLFQRLPAQAPCQVELSASYYTLQPPAGGDFIRTRLSRCLSLVFSSVEPYRHREEPRLLTELKTQLDLLNISRFEAHRGNQAELDSNDSTHFSD